MLHRVHGPVDERHGHDDRVLSQPGVNNDVELFAIRKKGVQGTLQVMVLGRFSDRPASLGTACYGDLIFSKEVYPTGSMRDYYAEASPW